MFGLSAGTPLATGAEEEKQSDTAAMPVSDAEPPQPAIFTQTGVASWYGAGFVNGKTASGERYRPNERTAAHRTLPFGTYVRVTNLKNNKSAVVRINNRGPFRKKRIIDLSKQAATDLAMLKTGLVRVRLEVLSKELAIAELAAVEPGQ